MPERKNIVMLEDSLERLERFARVLGEIDSTLVLVHWRSAWEMIRECPAYLHCCGLICLDHDLDPVDGDERDPGDGLDVARFLAPMELPCPVLIHSSNGDRATRMLGEFQLYDRKAWTILPLGADWVERYWKKRVIELLR